LEFSGFGGPPRTPDTRTAATQPTAPQPTIRPNRGGPQGQPLKPIKAFVDVRYQSVLDQLAGKSDGLALDGTPIRPRVATEAPPTPGFGPGFFLAPVILKAFDANKDDMLTREEFSGGFAKWFESWNTDKSGLLSEAQLRAGLNSDFVTQSPGPFARPPQQPQPPPQNLRP